MFIFTATFSGLSAWPIKNDFLSAFRVSSRVFIYDYSTFGADYI